MTVTPAPALLHGGTEPGWSPASVTPYGPGYCRYVPGQGMLKVGYESRQYRWWLLTGPAKARPGRDGFADPREAMRDADRLTAMLAPGMFEALTIDELRALYRELVQAYPEYHSGTTNTGRWYEELASVRDDVFGQMEIAALDPAYRAGPAVVRPGRAAGVYRRTRAGAEGKPERSVPPCRDRRGRAGDRSRPGRRCRAPGAARPEGAGQGGGTTAGAALQPGRGAPGDPGPPGGQYRRVPAETARAAPRRGHHPGVPVRRRTHPAPGPAPCRD